MKTTRFLTISALSLLAVSGGAFAAQSNGEDFGGMAQPIQSVRNRADVQAEALHPTRVLVGSTGVHAPGKGNVDRAEIRAEAVAAARSGQAAAGEINMPSSM